MDDIRVNIFIAHSPFQWLIANHMVKTMDEFSKYDNFLILDSLKKRDNDAYGNWQEIIILDPSIGRSVLGSGSNCRKALKIIEDICSEYQDIYLFRANLEWPLNNALIGSKLHSSSSNIVLCNYPEGIGSLLFTYPKFKQKIKTKIKSIIGLLGGAPFYSYKGDIMGMEASDRIYSLMPNVIGEGIEKSVVQIPIFEPLVLNVQLDTCIFLGQNYDNYISLQSYVDICTQAASFTNRLGFNNLFYKPHHYDISSVEREIFMSYGFSLLDDERAIEEIFLTDQYACVVSYNSSALVHLKMMLSDNVRCISCFSNQIFQYVKADRKRCRELFELCGVELFD